MSSAPVFFATSSTVTGARVRLNRSRSTAVRAAALRAGFEFQRRQQPQAPLLLTMIPNRNMAPTGFAVSAARSEETEKMLS
jgi:hypothetical protein